MRRFIPMAEARGFHAGDSIKTLPDDAILVGTIAPLGWHFFVLTGNVQHCVRFLVHWLSAFIWSANLVRLSGCQMAVGREEVTAMNFNYDDRMLRQNKIYENATRPRDLKTTTEEEVAATASGKRRRQRIFGIVVVLVALAALAAYLIVHILGL